MVSRGTLTESEITAADHGLPACSPADLRGGAPQDNARIGLQILRGERGPKRDTVLLNAGCALKLAGKVAELKDGISMSAEAIDSGRALQLLEKLRKLFPGE